MGFTSPGIPSVDSAVESWDSSHHDYSPTSIHPSQNLFKPGNQNNHLPKLIFSCSFALHEGLASYTTLNI